MSARKQPPPRHWSSIKPALSPWLISALDAHGFSRMTPVQASTLPLFLTNKDVIVEAVTGSGKTLAYLIPVLDKLSKSDAEGWPKRGEAAAIVIAPTRELASQIEEVLQRILAFQNGDTSGSHLDAGGEGGDAVGGGGRLFQRGLGDTGESPRGNHRDVRVGLGIPAGALSGDAGEGEARAAGREVGGGEGYLVSHDGGKIIRSQLLIGGGKTPGHDLRNFLGDCPQILIGTPGRLAALLGSSKVKMNQQSFQTLILDEADRLLDLGFQSDLQSILNKLPKQRRTGLFSATVNETVSEIIQVGLRNPYKVTVKVKATKKGAEHNELTTESRIPASLDLAYLVTPPSQRLFAISQILATATPSKTIIYMSTCAAVEYITSLLSNARPDFHFTPLHGKLTQSARHRNYDAFRFSQTNTVLVTTDIASRGLDIEQVGLVIQLDPPSDPKTFLHRAGRAGRAGNQGLAVLFLMPSEDDYVRLLALRGTPVTPLTDDRADLSSAIVADGSGVGDSVDLQNHHTLLQVIIMDDRALHERGQRAFVSWVKAYSKHQMSSIFQVKDLDWPELAKGWELLVLPKMPELSSWKAKGGDPLLGKTIDWEKYAYADPVREQKRLNPEPKADGEMTKVKSVKKRRRAIGDEAPSWSQQIAAQREREERRDKKRKRREAERVSLLSSEAKQDEADIARRVEIIRKRQKQAS